MKKIKVVLGLLVVFLLCITLILVNKNKTFNTFMKDDMMLAVVVDGVSSSTFPARGKYNVTVNCSNADGEWLPDTWEMAVQNITGSVVCNVTFTTIGNSDNNSTLANQIENSVGVSGNGSIVNENSAGYRYEGKDPNNYVWFNSELWRIIGSIPVCLTSGCGNSSTRLVKIVRNETISNLSYDQASTQESLHGAWGSNSLYKLLNGCYYSKKSTSGYDLNNSSTLCSNYCYSYNYYGDTTSMGISSCNYDVIGISNNSNDYYGSMIENVYWNTGNGLYNTNASTLYSREKTTQSVQGLVGLISASDYGYASNYGRATLDGYNTTDYTGSNWLCSTGEEWTLTQSSDTSYHIAYINEEGNLYERIAIIGYDVRPVVYLDSTVYAVSGDGSVTNPYKLAM